MQIAILGMGKMGRGLLEKLLADGHEVIVWNRSKEVLDKLKIEKSQYIISQKLKFSSTVEGVNEMLIKPRVIWIMVPAGEATEQVMSSVLNFTERGDVIIDGGNSNYKDTQKRYDELKEKGIRYLGVGVSGGVWGAELGYCIMAGGNKDGYDYVTPIFESMVKPEGVYNYFGEGGAGHFVKMVHNGIEYGMMQALGEGFGVLAKSTYDINLVDAGAVWQRGSILRSFLLDMAVNALKEEDLNKIEGYIASTGEGKWTVEAAKELHAPVNVIEESLEFRKRSEYDKAVQETFAAKMVAAIRKQFGGHSVQSVGGEENKQS